jgi:hypothetical protein
MTTIADTPDAIAFAQALVFRARLKMEVAGMTSRVNTLQAMNRIYGLKCRTRKDALATIENIIDMVKNQDHVLFPVGDGTVGLYERDELVASLA